MERQETLDINQILRSWEEEYLQPNYDPVPTLTKLAELIEAETENYLKMDPDPFDERHPSRAFPDCTLGHILKVLFRKDVFMNKLVNDYLRDTYWSRLNITGHNVDDLNIVACRLMLDTMPGLETSEVFQADMKALIDRLLKWATHSKEPLQTYATGLLAAAMEVPEIAVQFREKNLVPLMLQRLREIKTSATEATDNGCIQRDESSTTEPDVVVSERPFAHLTSDATPPTKADGGNTTPLHHRGKHKETNGSSTPDYLQSNASGSKRRKFENTSPLSFKTKLIGSKILANRSPLSHLGIMESSNSSWIEMENYVIGSIQMHPLTDSTKQMMILKYLTPMGEYQEFLGHMFEHKALDLILDYVNVRKTHDSRLAFEALKFLASLLCHKKFSLEFIEEKGLQRLLDIPQPSVAATGVSLCLYYLSYYEDAMERVCLLPIEVINSFVRYALWFLECSHHESGRCHAIMFFGLAFHFKVILDVFDKQDGLRKMYNVISTLPILSTDDDTVLSDDMENAMRQIVRHVCVALRRYLKAHLYLKIEQLRRLANRDLPNVPKNRVVICKMSDEDFQNRIDMLVQLLPFRARWQPVDKLMELGAITLLLQVIAFAYEWNYNGRGETVKSALDVLAVCSVMPRVQLLLCERVDLPEDVNTVTVGINYILGAAEGEIVADPDVQKAALSVIINCVCAPIHRDGSLARNSSSLSTPATSTPPAALQITDSVSPRRRHSAGTTPNRATCQSSEEVIERMWECVRTNNGIMVLLQLMQIKTPITDADCIRALACRALAGLARSGQVSQIVSKLPFFSNGELPNMLHYPILQEKRQEHVKFRASALELLKCLSGDAKNVIREIDVSPGNIHRENIVARTEIKYDNRQLVQLIHHHLMKCKLYGAAEALSREAQLASFQTAGSLIGTPSSVSLRVPSYVTPRRIRQTPSTPLINRSLSIEAPPSINETTENQFNGSMSVPNTPIKLKKKIATPSNSCQQQSTPSSTSLMKQGSCLVPKVPAGAMNVEEVPRITLDLIIKEYLKNQHALCKNPMATCPQFDLYKPHKCPDPKPRYTAVHSFTMRHSRRQLGFRSHPLDRRLVHSRFLPVQTFRLGADDNDGTFFTTACFMPGDQKLLVGTYSGEVKLFNIHTGNEDATYNFHDSYICNMQIDRRGKLLLTSSTWRRPLSALWDVEKDYDMKFPLYEDDYCEFSKLTQDKVIATKGEIASIYDIATGQKIATLTPTSSNQYTKNKATFSPTDELVLSDGVLWDAANKTQIHKFDKFNQMQSGVFHPNGLEVISSMEVWDLRTFKLLHTVSSLNQSHVVFNPAGDIIYGVALEQENIDDTTFESSFKTVDALQYTDIATIDVKKNIYDLCPNWHGTQIALVENQGMFDSVQESVVRLYDVGRRRNDEDEQEEEEEEDDMDDDDDSGSDSNSDNTNSLNIFLDAVNAAAQSQRSRRRRRRRDNANDGNAAAADGDPADNGGGDDVAPSDNDARDAADEDNASNDGEQNDEDEWLSFGSSDSNDDDGGDDDEDDDPFSMSDVEFDLF